MLVRGVVFQINQESQFGKIDEDGSAKLAGGFIIV